MNIKEVKKHVTFELVLIICTIICFLLSLYVILFTDIGVKATTSLDVTNGTTPGSACSTHPTGKLCYKFFEDYPTDTARLYTLGSTEYGVSAYWLSFYLNTSVSGFTNNTIQLKGSNFKNINYLCTSSYFSCSVTYVSSSQLNINFSNTSSTNITGSEFAIYTNNGSVFNSNNTFYINKLVYLYNDVGQGSTDTEDIMNNQNNNTNQILDSLSSVSSSIVNAINNAFNDCQVQMLDFSQIYVPSSYTNISYDINGNQITFVRSNSNTGHLAILIKNLKPNTDYKLQIGNVSTNYSLSSTILRIRTARGEGSWVTGQFAIESNKTYTFNTGDYTTGWLWVYMLGSNYGQFTISDLKIYDEHYCIDKQQELVDSQKELNDYMKDNSDPTVNNNGIDTVLSNVDYHNPLDYLLTLPFHLIQKINTLLSQNSCDRVSFGSLLGTELYLPCINIENFLGSSLFNTIDIFMAVGLLAVTLKKFYDSISNIITLGKEKEVKDKLELPTPMEFLSMILGGRD